MSRDQRAVILWKEAKSTIEKNLKKNVVGFGKIVTVQMTIPVRPCDHYFTMWKGNRIGIVHGYEGLFAAKVTYHKDWATLENILKRMFMPFNEFYPQQKDQTNANKKKTTTDRLMAFKELFGATLNGFNMPWLTKQNYEPDEVFHISNIYYGKPSSLIATISSACNDIKYLNKMEKTKRTCSKYLKNK